MVQVVSDVMEPGGMTVNAWAGWVGMDIITENVERSSMNITVNGFLLESIPKIFAPSFLVF
jgi:hypothetical protein